jgi:hypothetical protein
MIPQIGDLWEYTSSLDTKHIGVIVKLSDDNRRYWLHWMEDGAISWFYDHDFFYKNTWRKLS